MKPISCLLGPTLVVALVLLGSIASSVANSQEPPPTQETATPPPPRPEGVASPTTTQEALASTIHRHLGFYLRLETGPDFMYASEPFQGTTRSLSGPGWDFGFSIGGALCEDNILAIHLYGANSFSLNYSNTGASSSGSVFYLGALGPEYTHYFMPANIYLSIAALLTTATLTNSVITQNGGNSSTTVSNSYSTNVGLGPKIGLGKEWWVSDHWGVGLALQYAITWNHDTSGILGSSTLTTNVVSLDFSATYN